MTEKVNGSTLPVEADSSLKNTTNDGLETPHASLSSSAKDAKPPEVIDKSAVVKKAVIIAIVGEILIIIMMIAIINISYGVSWYPFKYTVKHMHVAIWIPSSSSNGIIETSLINIVNNKKEYRLFYDFHIVYSNDISYDEISEKVKVGRYYGAYAVNEGASDQLYAYLTCSSNIKPVNSFWYDQARSGSSYQLTLGTLGNLLNTLTNTEVTSTLLSQLSDPLNTLVVPNPELLASPVAIDVTTFAKVDRFGWFVAIGSATLQYYLIMLCHTMGSGAIHASLVGHNILRGSLIQFEASHRLFGSFVLSFWPPVIIWILGSNDFYIVKNTAMFFRFWMFLWLSFSVFGGIVYHSGKILGQVVGFLFNIILLVYMNSSNSSSAPYGSVQLFYQLGTGFPFYNVTQGLRSLLFKSEPQLFKQSIGVLFVWWSIMFFLVQSSRFDVIHRIRHWYKFHLIEDDHNVEAEEREKTKREARVEEKFQIYSQLSSVSRSGKSQKFDNKVHPNETNEDIAEILASDDMFKPPDNSYIHVDTEEVASTIVFSRKLTSQLQIIEEEHKEHPELEKKLKNVIREYDEQEENHDVIPLLDHSVRPFLTDVIKKIIALEIFLSIIFIILLFFTFGSAWNPFYYHKHVHIAMLNLDSTTSNTITPFTIGFNAVYNSEALHEKFKFTLDILDPNENTIEDVHFKVDEGRYFAGFVVNANATNNLYKQIDDLSYTPPDPIIYYFNQARGDIYIVNYLRLWGNTAASVINSIVSSMVISENYNDLKTSNYNLFALADPAVLKTEIIHPFPSNAPGSDGAISNAAVTMYLGNLAQALVIFASHAQFQKIGLDYYHRFYANAIHLLGGTLVLSFWPSISFVWFGFKMTGAQFFSLWPLIWLGMCAISSYLMTNYHFFGSSQGSIFNILMFSLNQAGSTGTLPIELQPSFFSIGLALPSANIVYGSRYILFNSNHFACKRAIGILIAWVTVVAIASYRLELRKKHFQEIGNLARALSGRITTNDDSKPVSPVQVIVKGHDEIDKDPEVGIELAETKN